MTVRLAMAMPRVEDLRLVRGAGRYTDDLAPADAAWAVLVRSPHAHADIKAIDLSIAHSMPGVLCVLSAADYRADGLKPLTHRANPPDALDPSVPWFNRDAGGIVLEWDQPPLVDDRVRFVGEAIALVVATTLGAARDAADQVAVDYDVRPALVDAYAAKSDTGPPIWAEVPNNLALLARLGDPLAVDATIAGSHLVLDRRFHNQRLVNCQMEPRSAFASFDAESGYTVTAGGQGVVRQRAALAMALGVAPASVRLMTPDTGGGFGPRTSLNPEPVLAAWAARRLGRTVRWMSDRTEAFVSDYQARDQWTRIVVGFDESGRFLALRSEQTGNLGAYPLSFAPLANGQRIVPTCYHVPQVYVETQGVITNTTPTVPYRGAGRPEAHFAIERLLDMAARKLDIDRVEIRRRNLVSRSAMPYRSATGLTYDSGDFRGNIDAVLALSDWNGFAARRAESSARGTLRGIAVCNYVETPVGAAVEKAVLTVQSHGDVKIISGTQSTGQGHETTFAQVVAAMLDIDPARVHLRTGDTRFVTMGGGTHSDRSARLLGALLHKGCTNLIRLGQDAAAVLLDEEAGALRFGAGAFHARDGRSCSLYDIARAFENGSLPTQMGTAFATSEEINGRIPAYPTGCAACEVEVDPETGEVSIVRYSSVDDVGQPINPLVVDGQVHGGIVQGAGQALCKNFAIDRSSGQVLSASFMDYGLMRASDLPSFDVALAEDPTTHPDNPLRIKGGGEGGITPATAVIINALIDALQPLGIEHIEMPATPLRVWTAIQNAKVRRLQAEAAE